MNPFEMINLPDGSAFSTSVVMTKAEAMLLPHAQRPLCFRISSELSHAVFCAVGAAYALGAVSQKADKACKVATTLCLKIAEDFEKKLERKDRALLEALQYSGHEMPDLLAKEIGEALNND
jgi:hypothetical protein